MGNRLSTCTTRRKKKRKPIASSNENIDVSGGNIRDSSEAINSLGNNSAGQDASRIRRHLPRYDYHRDKDDQAKITSNCLLQTNDFGTSNEEQILVSDFRRRLEPPRLIMWGLYEPKYPGKDWALRVQQERVSAMQYGKADWRHKSSLPQYLRQYLRENAKTNQTSQPCKGNKSGKDFKDDGKVSAHKACPNQPRGHENLGFDIQCQTDIPAVSTRMETMINPIQITVVNHETVNEPSVPRPSTHLSESDSAFRSLSSCISNPDLSSSASYNYASRSRCVKQELRLRRKELISFPPPMFDKATQYEKVFNGQTFTERDNTVSDSYAALQESLDILQSAVNELDDFAGTLLNNNRVPSSGFTKETQCSGERKIFEDGTINRNSPSSTFETSQPTRTMSVYSNGDDAEQLPADIIHIFPNDRIEPTVESSHDTEHIDSGSLTDVQQSSQLSETIIGDEVWKDNTETLKTTSSTESLRTRSSRNSEVNGSVNYRLRIVASPQNLNLFKLSALSFDSKSNSKSKSLLQIAKDNNCQLYLLPKKDYSAGLPKRTLLIRAPNRRCIKMCLKEISGYFPSLIKIY